MTTVVLVLTLGTAPLGKFTLGRGSPEEPLAGGRIDREC